MLDDPRFFNDAVSSAKFTERVGMNAVTLAALSLLCGSVNIVILWLMTLCIPECS
jgi:hypothetical protein